MRSRRMHFEWGVIVAISLGLGPAGRADDRVVTGRATDDLPKGWSRSSIAAVGCSSLFPAKPSEKAGSVTTLGVVSGGMRYEIAASREIDGRMRRGIEGGGTKRALDGL